MVVVISILLAMIPYALFALGGFAGGLIGIFLLAAVGGLTVGKYYFKRG